MNKLLVTILLFCVSLTSAEAGIVSSKPAPPTKPSESQLWDAMENAIKTNNMGKLSALLKSGGNPNYKFSSGLSLLCQAIDLKNFDAVQILLSNGANVTDYARFCAYRNFDRKIFNLLLSNRSQIAWLIDAIWQTRNSQFSKTELIQYLIDYGAPVNALYEGQTALHVAAGVGAYEIVQVLLANGADASIKDATGNLPEHVAMLKSRFPGIADRLREARIYTK